MLIGSVKYTSHQDATGLGVVIIGACVFVTTGFGSEIEVCVRVGRSVGVKVKVWVGA